MMTTGRGELRILEGPAEVAGALADLVVETARDAIQARGRFCIALAGGTTPKVSYALLAVPPRRDAVEWERVRVFFGDERCVPPDNEQSNYHTAREALLKSVPLRDGAIFRMRGEAQPDEAARQYAEVLRRELGAQLQFDLLLLGMGPDAHTASLFPGSDPFVDAGALVRAPYVEKLQSFRLTITPTVINAARTVVVATEGTAKAEALRNVFEHPDDPTERPIQSVHPVSGRLVWLVDRAAAQLLAKT